MAVLCSACHTTFNFLSLQPSAVMADFELALIQAVELHSARVLGCFFHFSQCLWGKVQALGLSGAYTSDASIKCFIHKAAALSFVPPTFLRIAWAAIQADAPNKPSIPEFIDYFDSTWMNGK